MSPYSPTPIGIAFDEVRPGVLAMGREPSGQAPHLRNHGFVLLPQSGRLRAEQGSPLSMTLGEVPSAEEFGDTAMDRGEAVI